MVNTLDCKNIEQLFSDYYDNMLTPVEQEAFYAHIANCHSCKIEYAKYHAVLTELANMPDIEYPPNLHENLMDYVHENKGSNQDVFSPLIQSTAKPKHPLWRTVAYSGVAAACIALAFVWMFNYIDQVTPQPPYIEDGTIPFARFIEYIDEPVVEATQSNNAPLAIAISIVLVGIIAIILFAIGKMRKQKD